MRCVKSWGGMMKKNNVVDLMAEMRSHNDDLENRIKEQPGEHSFDFDRLRLSKKR